MNTSQRSLERLKTLYSISKKLSVFSSIEKSFPDIFACAAESFPLSSAVIIEHWEKKPNTAIWSEENLPEDVIARSIQHAKEAYSYLSGASEEEAAELIAGKTGMNKLIRGDKSFIFNESEIGYFIVVPLIIDNLPALGALQMEGNSSLDEEDLDFVIALANLMSVALDRFYKSKRQREIQEKEVQFLENERDLREAFVNLLTHDLRSPMSVVLTAAQMILRRPEDIEATKRSAGLVVENVHRATNMVTDLLDANLIQSGGSLQIHKEKVELSEFVKTTVAALSIIYGERFILETPGRIEIEIDSHGVRRIIENLCNNAIKYGSQSAPVRIKLEDSKKEVVISVANEGSYIVPADQKSLFEQFRRSDDAHAGKVKGWGIGLTLVQGMTIAHGGEVSVSSDRKKGTVFTVSLPRQ